MILMLDLDPNILKTYLRTKNEDSRSRFSKVRARKVQTLRRSERITTPHSRLVMHSRVVIKHDIIIPLAKVTYLLLRQSVVVTADRADFWNCCGSDMRRR